MKEYSQELDDIFNYNYLSFKIPNEELIGSKDKFVKKIKKKILEAERKWMRSWCDTQKAWSKKYYEKMAL